MKETRGREETKQWIGIDSGEQRHHLVLLDTEGQEQTVANVRNRPEAVEEALVRLVGDAGGPVAVMVESIRSVGFVVSEVALRMGLELWSAGTKSLEDYRDFEGQPRKDDDRDAYLLARMGYTKAGGARRLIEARPAERRICRLSRSFRRAGADRTRALQRLRCCLVELCPQLLGDEAPTWSSGRMLRVLRRWPALMGLERAQRKTISHELRGGRVAKRAQEVEFLRTAAAEVVMSDEEREVVAEEIVFLLDQIDLLEARQERVEAQLEELVDQHPQGHKLLEMEGIGVIVAAVLIGEVLPVARHATEAQTATYCGVTPLSRSSGQSQRSRLSRRVNKHALHALYISAISATRTSSIDRAYYDKKRQDFKGHPAEHVKATLALARQRTKLIYKLLTTEARYDKEVLIRSHLERRAA